MVQRFLTLHFSKSDKKITDKKERISNHTGPFFNAVLSLFYTALKKRHAFTDRFLRKTATLALLAPTPSASLGDLSLNL